MARTHWFFQAAYYPAVTETVRDAIDRLNAQRVQIGATLQSLSAGQISWRPPSGKWTIHENLRHLVLTGFAHIQFLGLPEWEALNLSAPIEWRRRTKMVGDDGTPVGALLAAWEEVHSRAAVAAARFEGVASDRLERHLQQHLRHQSQHVLEIEKLLRAQARLHRQLDT